MNRIFSGIQPTGNLHLGNYLGAIRNWVALQHDYECIFCIVDLHALTLPQDPAELRASTREVTAAYIAAGIDPERCIIFNQSMVSAHAELAWLLACLTPLGWLNRMTQFKEKAGKQRDMAGLGLYAYPVLMAADILVYKATHVPVGEDQKQHLELARDIAGAFNRRYERDFFPLPEPQIFGTADTAATAAALAAYAAGLPAFVLVKVLAPAFFARHDTATPVKVAVLAMAINLGLTLILMQFLAHVGIALATTAAGWLNALMLLALLVRRRHFAFDRRARRNLPRVGAAALGMGVVLAGLRMALAPMLAGPSVLQVAALIGLVGAGLAVFAVLGLGLGIADWRDLCGRLRRQPA